MGKNPLERSPRYPQGLELLTYSQKSYVFDAIGMFQENPREPSLRAHLLSNSQNITSITADDDLRILLRVRSDGSILLIDVGTHERVYGE